jgi:cytidylate kinase
VSTRIIAIDGPAGSGKSTTAKLVAKKLGFVYLDTGAMYRAITLKVLQKQVNPRSEKEVSRIAESSSVEIEHADCSNRIILDGKDITDKIRDLAIDQNVSFVSEHRKVREILVNLQRKIGETENVVAEGRDVTTVVFPDAFVKIYLDCDLKERARRRILELQQKGILDSVEEQTEKIASRDEIDSKRRLSPLTKDKDAFVIDTTHLTIEEQVRQVVQIYEESLP